MNPQAGTTARLTVDRETPPYGYFLSAGTRDILLPYGETEGRLSPGDEVDAFLFHDAKDRLTATMRKPLARLGETALLTVAGVHPALGCFLDIGIGRDVLLPRSELPGHPAAHPAVGDRIFAVLDHDKAGRMLARAAGEAELAPRASAAPADWKNRTVEAIVYAPQKTATFVVCRDGRPDGFGVLGMIHASERTRTLRLGETVHVRVARVREDGRVNLSMFPLKEQGLEADAARLLAFLQARPNGAIPYSDETPPDIIREKFHISKGAFKRAIGRLMKDGLVYQKGHWTHLAEPARTGGEEAAMPREAAEAAREAAEAAREAAQADASSGTGRSGRAAEAIAADGRSRRRGRPDG